MKKNILLLCLLFAGASPALAWGNKGDGECPYSKGNSNQETKTEQLEESNKRVSDN